MIRREFLASLVTLIGCGKEEIKPMRVNTLMNIISTPAAGGYTLTTGQTTFPMTDVTAPAGVPGENLVPELYLRWYVPAKGNLSLLVFLNGWSSGGDFLPIQSTRDYLTAHNIAIVSIGKRGRNADPGYTTDTGHGTNLENYRDASGIEPFDIYQTVQYFLSNIVTSGQIDTDKIFGYGTSGGGGNVLATASKFPDFFSMIVDWFGMAKYGSYPGDPDSSWKGWALDDVGYQGDIYLATGGPSIGGIGYVTGINDGYYLSRDHIRGIANFKGKLHMYHYTGDGYVAITQSDKLETALIANGQTYAYHRSTSVSLYDHGNFDIEDSIFDSVTPYGLHWVTDAQNLTRTALANSGTMFVAGYVITRSFQLWTKRYRNNASAYGGYRNNQGRTSACSLTYNVSSNTYQITAIFPTSPLEPYCFVNLIVGSWDIDVMIAENDIITLSPKTLNKQPGGLNYTWTLFYDLSDTDGYILDDAGNVSNLIDLTGHDRIAWQQTRASRKAVSGGGLLNPIYLMRSTSGTLNTLVESFQLTGTFSLIVKVNAVTVGTSKNILGRGTSGIYIEVKAPYTKTQIILNIGGTSFQPLNNSTNTENGTGLMVIGVRRDSSNNIYLYTKSAAGFFVYGPSGILGNSANAFDIASIGGVSTTNQFDGTIYRVATSQDDIGATDMQTLLNAWYAA